MKKILGITIFIAIFIITTLFLTGLLKAKWLEADMGYCQRYGTGLRLGETIIFKLDKGASACV